MDPENEIETHGDNDAIDVEDEGESTEDADTNDDGAEDDASNGEQEESAPVNPVRQLREAHKKQAAENRQLRQKLRELEQAIPRPAAIEKPTLEGSGFDEDVYSANLLKWSDSKRAQDEQARARQASEQESQQEWLTQAKKYQAGIAKLGDKGADAQSIVASYTTAEQQSVIIMAAKNPAMFVANIAQNDGLMAELSTITNPAKLAAFIARAEVNMAKQSPAKPAPEQGMTRSSSPGGTQSLDKLYDACLKTGDMTKYYQARRLKDAKK